MAKKKKIYRDFDDYWRFGNHNCTSASRDWIKKIWDDLEPTIMANRGDWEKLLIDESRKERDNFIEFLQNIHAYLDEFKLEEVAGVKFFRWLFDQRQTQRELKKPRKSKKKKSLA